MEWPTSTIRVLDTLESRGVRVEIIVSATSTRTVAEAAESLGTSVNQIVKSLLFLVDERPILVLMSGVNRLDERKLALVAGGTSVRRASAEQVRAATGFAIGGIPPISTNPELRVVCDADLLLYPVVYAAAGTPHHNFALPPEKLVEVAGALVADLKVLLAAQ